MEYRRGLATRKLPMSELPFGDNVPFVASALSPAVSAYESTGSEMEGDFLSRTQQACIRIWKKALPLF